jgi:hypothetical protein
VQLFSCVTALGVQVLSDFWTSVGGFQELFTALVVLKVVSGVQDGASNREAE